jgi:hypothetical protein
MMKLRSAFVVLAISAVASSALWLSPMSADANVSAWAQPVKISGALREPWFPTISADDSGNVHVVFQAAYADTPRLDISALFYAHTSSDQIWSQPNDIAVIYSGHALRSSIGTDSAGRTHVIYKGWGSLKPDPDFDPPRNLGAEDLWYMSLGPGQPDSVGSWSPRQQITRNPQGYYSDMAIDSHGVIHAIWTESDSLGWGLHYANSSDGGETWTNQVALNETGSVWWYRAHLEVDSFDRVHVAWEVTTQESLGRTRAAFYALSLDGGQTWKRTLLGGQPLQKTGGDPSPTPPPTPPAVASTPIAQPTATAAPTGPQQPTIGVDGQREIMLVYRENETNLIFYQVSVDGTRWSLPQRLPGVRQGVYRPYDIYDMVTDSAGHIHLAFVGYPDGSQQLNLLHSEWDEHSWSAPRIVPSPPNPEYPKLALSVGNRLHLVWFVGDRDSIDRTPLGVYYSAAETSAPRSLNNAVPVPNPTPLPAPPPDAMPVPAVIDPARQLLPIQAEGSRAPPPEDVFGILGKSSFPLFAAVIPVLVLVGGAILYSLGFGRFTRRH